MLPSLDSRLLSYKTNNERATLYLNIMNMNIFLMLVWGLDSPNQNIFLQMFLKLEVRIR